MSKQDRTGWYFDRQFEAWRPVSVLTPREQDSIAHLEVELNDGTHHQTGLLDFLWHRPTFPNARISDD